MYFVPFFVCWCSLQQLASSAIDQSLLHDISSGKPKHTEIYDITDHYQMTINNSISCETMLGQRLPMRYAYYIDFQDVYPIIQINMYAFGTVENNVTVYIDGTLCNTIVLKPGVYFSSTFGCQRYIKGRMLSLDTSKNFGLCLLTVYTCVRGWEGPMCRTQCSPGNFGLGCVYSCKCRKYGDICHPETGFCKTGCQSLLLDSDFGCIVRRRDNKNTSAIHYLTTPPVWKIATMPYIEDIRDVVVNRVPGKHDGITNARNECVTILDSTRITILLRYALPISVEGILIQHLSVNLSLPVHLLLLADGIECLRTVISPSFPKSIQRFMCQRYGLKASRVMISYIIQRVKLLNAFSIDICRLGVLECPRAYYGPQCTINCNCMSSTCDSLTGVCPRGLCHWHHSGRNCASYNIVINNKFKILFFSKAGQYSDHPPFHLEFYYSKYGLWKTWWAVELDQLYEVNEITIYPAAGSGLREASLAVYFSSSVLSNISYGSKDFWSGFPCQIEPPSFDQPVDIYCPTLSRSFVIVIGTVNEPPRLVIVNFKIAECTYGTYGPKCEGICRCLNKTEKCDKRNGSCKSGCAQGFKYETGHGCVEEDLRRPIVTPYTCHCTSGPCPWGLDVCTDGCQVGWTGLSCNISCSPDTYGPDCAKDCVACYPAPLPTQRICDVTTGVCIFGCVDSDECVLDIMLAKPEDSSSMAYSTKVTIITLVICAIIILFGGFVCKYFWMKMTKEEEDIYKFKNLAFKREVTQEMNDQILRDHREYHESFLKREVLGKALQNEDLDPNLPIVYGGAAGEQTSDKLAKQAVAAFELKKQPVVPKVDMKPVGQGKPLGQDHEQQDSDVKVALWVLTQNFDEFIQRRRERLANYQGNILDIQESTYSIPKVDIEGDIHELYDEIAPLELP